MMKCMLALVVLFHLCNSVNSNNALNDEIIMGLRNLTRVYKNYKFNVTSTKQDLLHVPSTDMVENASSCIGVFIRELKNLLNYLPQHKKSVIILQELRANLGVLGTHQENDQQCKMTSRESSTRVNFKPYISFLQTLNSLEER